MNKKLKCDCCKKSFKELWKDYRYGKYGNHDKYHVCRRCINLNDLNFFELMEVKNEWFRNFRTIN